MLTGGVGRVICDSLDRMESRVSSLFRSIRVLEEVYLFFCCWKLFGVKIVVVVGDIANATMRRDEGKLRTGTLGGMENFAPHS